MVALLTKNDAADRLGVSISVVTRLVNENQLESVALGKRVGIEENSIDEYLHRTNRIKAPADKSRTSKALGKTVNLSFFSGAGGLDLGLERAGLPSLLFCENYKEARMTLFQNRPEAALAGDITTLDAKTIRELSGIGDHEIDVMSGGPPCQAFSTAGARRAFDDPRGNVFLKYLELARELQPRYLVIENVRGLLSTPFPLSPGKAPVKGGALHLILDRLKNAGYKTTFNLYNAANYGAAQIRERVVIIAKRDGSPMPWLRPTHSNDPAWQEQLGLNPWRTFGDVAKEIGDTVHHHAQFPAKRLKYFEKLSAGQCWTSLPEEDQEAAMGKSYGLSGGKTGFYRRISFNRPSPTLVTSPTMPATDLCHPTELRPLSVEEYKAIQGFPPEWWIAGSMTDTYKQIGNAVPVELGEAIGRAIVEDMAGRAHDMSELNGFPFSRYRNSNNLTWKPAVQL